MSLAFTGPSGTAEHRWIVYALLRDNVQHHLEGGTPDTTDFEALHAIDAALGGNPVRVNARQFRRELDRASVLLPQPIAFLAISNQTRAILDRSWRASDRRGSRTTSAEGVVSTIPWLSSHARTLDDVFGNLVRSLMAITSLAGEADVVEVDDN
jgi:hypothetical protein